MYPPIIFFSRNYFKIGKKIFLFIKIKLIYNMFVILLSLLSLVSPILGPLNARINILHHRLSTENMTELEYALVNDRLTILMLKRAYHLRMVHDMDNKEYMYIPDNEISFKI
tara:strand:+ start:115 stop:450 length:336 start_codon:yes stop_codon:yes gene_type:complete